MKIHCLIIILLYYNATQFLINLKLYAHCLQVTPVPPNFVTQARDSTPDDYPYRNSGFATTVGQIASQNLQVCKSFYFNASHIEICLYFVCSFFFLHSELFDGYMVCSVKCLSN